MISVEKKPHQIGLWASLLDIFFIDDWCERSQIIVGCATPGLVVLDARRNWAEQGMRSRMVSSTPPFPTPSPSVPASGPCFEILA